MLTTLFSSLNKTIMQAEELMTLGWTLARHNSRRVAAVLASMLAQTPISRSDSRACPNIFQSSRNYGHSAHLARLMNFRFLIHPVKLPDSVLILMYT